MFNHMAPPNLQELKVIQSATGKRFYVTPDDNKYPSITTVLGIKEKPALTNWRNMLGEKKAKSETKRCSDRGNAVHLMAERFINNEKEYTRGQAAVHIREFNKLKFKLNAIDNVRGQELALYSDVLKVAGRVDCVGEYNGTLSIIDFKTSNNNKAEDLIQDYFLQATAYAIMWHELTEEAIENIVIMMSVENGMVPLVFETQIDKYVLPLLQRIKKPG